MKSVSTEVRVLNALVALAAFRRPRNGLVVWAGAVAIFVCLVFPNSIFALYEFLYVGLLFVPKQVSPFETTTRSNCNSVRISIQYRE